VPRLLCASFFARLAAVSGRVGFEGFPRVTYPFCVDQLLLSRIRLAAASFFFLVEERYVNTSKNSVWHVSGYELFSHQDRDQNSKSHRGPEAVLHRFLQMDLLPAERENIGFASSLQSVFPITDFREPHNWTSWNSRSATGSASAANSRAISSEDQLPVLRRYSARKSICRGRPHCPQCGTANTVSRFCADNCESRSLFNTSIQRRSVRRSR